MASRSNAVVLQHPVPAAEAVARLLKNRMLPRDFKTLSIGEGSRSWARGGVIERGPWLVFVAAKRPLDATVAFKILEEHYPVVRRDGLLVTVGME